MTQRPFASSHVGRDFGKVTSDLWSSVLLGQKTSIMIPIMILHFQGLWEKKKCSMRAYCIHW